MTPLSFPPLSQVCSSCQHITPSICLTHWPLSSLLLQYITHTHSHILHFLPAHHNRASICYLLYLLADLGGCTAHKHAQMCTHDFRGHLCVLPETYTDVTANLTLSSADNVFTLTFNDLLFVSIRDCANRLMLALSVHTHRGFHFSLLYVKGEQ